MGIDDMDSSSCTCLVSRKSKHSRKKTLVVGMKTWLLPLLFLTLCTYGKALGFVKKTDDEGPAQELEILHRMNIVNRNLHSKYRRKMRQEDNDDSKKTEDMHDAPNSQKRTATGGVIRQVFKRTS